MSSVPVPQHPEKWKVFLVTPKFYPETAGYAHAITGLVRTVREKYPEVEFSVLTMSKDDRPDPELPGFLKGLPIKRGQQKGIHRYLFEIRNLFYAIREFKRCDVVFFETADLFILGFFAGLLVPEKIIIREQGCWSSEIIRFKNTLIFRLCRLLVGRHYRKAKVLAPTTRYYNRFVQEHYFNHNEYVAATKKYSCIPNTTYLTPEAGGQAREEIASKYDVDPKARWFLTLGRQDLDGILQKGFEDILHALARYQRKQPEAPPWVLFLVGQGDQHERLKALADKLGLRKHLVFIEKMPHEEVRALTGAVDVVMLCSRFEGMSMFATESLAMGKALLLTQAGGLCGMVEPGQNGYTAEPGDIPGIERAFGQMLAADGKAIADFGANSRRLFEAKFHPDRVADEFIHALYLTLS